MTNNSTFLVVDSDESLLNTFHQIVKLHGDDSIKLLEARDGSLGLSKIQNQPFDCIFTDFDLPKKSGTPFINSVRTSALNQKTPIVVLSKREKKELPLQQFEFIESAKKPLDLEEISNFIQKHSKNKDKENFPSPYLFNQLVQATSQLAKDFTGCDFTNNHHLSFKPRNTKLESDLIFEMPFIYGNKNTTFAIGLHRAEILLLQKARVFRKDKSPKHIASAFSEVIFSHIIKNCHSASRNHYRIGKMSWSDGHLVEKEGLLLNLENEEVSIDLFAHSSQSK